MKRLFVLLAALIALAAVLAGSALAGGNPAPKPTADISFVITSTTTPYAFVGETATFVLHDGGEPGVGHDYISNSSWTSPTITAGNLQVHA